MELECMPASGARCRAAALPLPAERDYFLAPSQRPYKGMQFNNTHTHTHTHVHTYTCTAVYLSFVHPYLPGVVEGTCGRTAALTEPNVTPGHTFQHVPIEAAVVGCVCVCK